MTDLSLTRCQHWCDVVAIDLCQLRAALPYSELQDNRGNCIISPGAILRQLQIQCFVPTLKLMKIAAIRNVSITKKVKIPQNAFAATLFALNHAGRDFVDF